MNDESTLQLEALMHPEDKQSRRQRKSFYELGKKQVGDVVWEHLRLTVREDGAYSFDCIVTSVAGGAEIEMHFAWAIGNANHEESKTRVWRLDVPDTADWYVWSSHGFVGKSPERAAHFANYTGVWVYRACP